MSNFDDDYEDDEEYQEQLENLIAENGVLLHALVGVLVNRGVIRREELEAQIQKLTDEMEAAADDEDE